MNALFPLPAPRLTPDQARQAYENVLFGNERPKPELGQTAWYYTGEDYVVVTVTRISKSGKTFAAHNAETGLGAWDIPVGRYKPCFLHPDKPKFL
ncbi:hypothetical protein EQG79_30105 [Spirosoma sordidisoli]|uniref:Uncharacterized protein n=1 Tax=Spirosoma sordidisoli TaxID=2502893 RepID=A0A4Q2UGE4_9BACT|nr:hypothetical protein EQG79_30105 [Spirosoma sordidisoli]